MRRWTWMATVAAMATSFLPPPVAAQTSDALGIVTTLDGRVTVARPALSSPLALKFKDDVFGRDRISTQENSLVRVLLGGKAILTVRELSQVTISEEPGRAVVTLPDGKVVLAVDKKRMRPGESIEIRTPNAVAAVRGSLISVERNAAQNYTVTICSAGDCLRGPDSQNLVPLKAGEKGRNLDPPTLATASELNGAFGFRTGTPTFTSVPESLQSALIQEHVSTGCSLYPTPCYSTINSTINKAIQMNSIAANTLKTQGVLAIERALADQPDAAVTVRGQVKYVVMGHAQYVWLRECELEAALAESRADSDEIGRAHV